MHCRIDAIFGLATSSLILIFRSLQVVQWYGNTLRGVAAENNFSNCNVKPGGNDGGGALGGVGECYHGSDPLFFTEYVFTFA